MAMEFLSLMNLLLLLLLLTLLERYHPLLLIAKFRFWTHLLELEIKLLPSRRGRDRELLDLILTTYEGFARQLVAAAAEEESEEQQQQQEPVLDHARSKNCLATVP
jgi:hypothetical protein